MKIEMGVSQNSGPQSGPQYTMIRIVETTKKGAPNCRNTPNGLGDGGRDGDGTRVAASSRDGDMGGSKSTGPFWQSLEGS